MAGNHLASLGALVAALLLSGCVKMDPRAGFPDIERSASERLGAEAKWHQSAADEEASAKQVASLLEAELTPESALQLAFLKNPDLQAIYETLGIAHADLVQAGLLENPVFAAAPRFGVGSISGTGQGT